MKKMSIEVMEQLLKDLAANVGYELISNPFDTPFEESSLEMLPEDKQFIWPVPASVLNDEAHKDFRNMWVNTDLIDTVAELSLAWPSNAEDHMAILLIDLTRSRRGTVKFVDTTAWDISDETDMAAVCNFLIHDLFPGEDLLAFEMNDDAMDLGVDDRWFEQVVLVSAAKINGSLLPHDYLPRPIAKQGFEYVRLDDIFYFEDLKGAAFYKNVKGGFSKWLPKEFIIHDNNMLELKVSAITVSVYGNLRPQKIDPEATSGMVDLNEKIILRPKSYIHDFPDLDYLVEQLSKESTLRQLPFLTYPNARLEEEHLIGVLIEIPKTKIYKWRKCYE